MKRAIFLLVLVFPLTVFGQSDHVAGLFTPARQLPLVSQSMVVRIEGADARIELTQVFANEGDEIAQADYRLHLPDEAVVTGFGFWNDGRFLAAELKERGEARADHTAAADSGRATAVLERESMIHSFSVYPVLAGSLQQVEVTFTLPIATERGRSHLRLPIDTFLGHARLTSTVVAHIQTRESLRALGVDGASATERDRQPNSADLVFSAAEAVEVWWASEVPPLLTRAEAVALDDGSYALQLRLGLNDLRADRNAVSEIRLLIDTSFSMRRRGRAIVDLLDRVLDQARVPVRVYSVAERSKDVTSPDRRDMFRQLLSGESGFATSWTAIEAAASEVGCDDPNVLCVAVTDPQVTDLLGDRSVKVLFIADADELAHFSESVGPGQATYQPDSQPAASLHALADELVLPVLELRRVTQDDNELALIGAKRMRIAAGGLLRLFLTSTSAAPLDIELAIGTRLLERKTGIEILDPDSRFGRAVRRGYYSGRLSDWGDEYRKSRDPEIRKQIVAVSLREGIPTDHTSLHVASPDRVLPRTGSWAPLLRLIGILALLASAILTRLVRWSS